MKKLLIFVLSLAGAIWLHGAENLSVNGNFALFESGCPLAWKAAGITIQQQPDGSADGKAPALAVSGKGTLRQHSSISLMTGKKYRLSVWVKCAGGNANSVKLYVHNTGWNGAYELKMTPNDQWQKFSGEFEAFPSSNKRYSFAFRFSGSGEAVYISGLSLEAVSGKIEQEKVFIKLPSTLLPRDKAPEMLANGALKSKNGKTPDLWGLKGNIAPVYHADGGPENMPYVTFKGCPGTSLRQDAAVKLHKGEFYRFGMWVRTRNFRAGNAMFVAFNHGFRKACGIFNAFPANSDWVYIERIVEAPEGPGGFFGVTVLFMKFQGEIDVAGLSIKPATEAAGKGLPAPAAEMNKERLVPLYPRLNRILASAPELHFRWFGKSAASAAYRIDGKTAKTAQLDKDGLFKLDLAGIPEGRHDVTINIGSFAQTFAIVINPALEQVKETRLNNLCSVISKKKNTANIAVEFVNPRDGWVMFYLPEGGSVKLSGDRQGIFKHYDFLYLPAGKYSYTLQGNAPADVEIRSIAETLIYPMASGPYVPGFKQHDWAFWQKYMLDYFTTYTAFGACITPAIQRDLRKNGHYRMLRSLGHTTFFALDTPEKISSYASKDIALNDNYSNFDGVDLDELPISNMLYQTIFMNMLPYLPQKNGKVFNAWCTGEMTYSPLTADFSSALANYNGGKILYETYCITQPDEKSAMEFIRHYNGGIVSELEKLCPGSRRNLGLIMCHANVPWSFSCANYPEVNFKYNLDLQFQHIATDPACRDLGMIGYWGDHYADEELSRFAAALVRHYVFEGNTELYSKKLGYNYIPGHLQNGDFARGFDHWQKSGDITIGRFPQYGKRYQKRFMMAEGEGETFAVLTRGAQAATLSQTAKNLQPGKLYKLQYLTNDAAGVDGKGNVKPQQCTLTLTLQGAAVLPEHTIAFRANKRYRGNLDQVVFRAEKSEVELTFSNVSAAPNSRTALNFVTLMPYFEGK